MDAEFFRDYFLACHMGKSFLPSKGNTIEDNVGKEPSRILGARDLLRDSQLLLFTVDAEDVNH